MPGDGEIVRRGAQIVEPARELRERAHLAGNHPDGVRRFGEPVLRRLGENFR